MQQRNIVLVGFMGSGKSVTGRVLSERTGMPLVDMDVLIEERAGKPIADLFRDEGEAAFRTLERELTQELARRRGLIISTGGGIVLDPRNLSDFGAGGLVVCLAVSAETVFERVAGDTTRPLLSGDKKEQIRTLLAARRPLYDAVAHQVDADRLNPRQRADEILRLYSLETGE